MNLRQFDIACARQTNFLLRHIKLQKTSPPLPKAFNHYFFFLANAFSIVFFFPEEAVFVFFLGEEAADDSLFLFVDKDSVLPLLKISFRRPMLILEILA